MNDDFDYTQLDPGIRETVRRLRGWGWPTVDSGDGHSKYLNGGDPGEILNIPHVVISVDAPEYLVQNARTLLNHLKLFGIEVATLGPDGKGVAIQASFDPADNSAVLLLTGVDDDSWTRD